MSATSGGFDLGFKLDNGYTVYFSANFSNSRFAVMLNNDQGQRIFNKTVTLT